jgi:hypothetical protein
MSFRLKPFIGHHLRELIVHGDRLRQPSGRPRLVILPCSSPEVGSSNLRAFQLGKILRGLGWRTSVIPPQCSLRQRKRIISLERPDLILIQKGRHPLNWPKYYPGYPLAFDIDDADFIDDRQVDQVIACCAGSRIVLAGSRFVADWCAQHNDDVEVVWTGGPVLGRTPKPQSSRKAILTWASSDPVGYPEEANLVRGVIERLTPRISFEFWLYGARPSWPRDYVSSFERLGVPVRVFSYMEYSRFMDSLDEVAVGLNPIDAEGYSQGKSFGKILGYLATNVAVVASNRLEMPHFFRQGVNGFLADTIDEWVEYTGRLLSEPELRQAIVDRAREDYVAKLSSGAIAEQVDRTLRRVLKGGRVRDAESRTALPLPRPHHDVPSLPAHRSPPDPP